MKKAIAFIAALAASTSAFATNECADYNYNSVSNLSATTHEVKYDSHETWFQSNTDTLTITQLPGERLQVSADITYDGFDSKINAIFSCQGGYYFLGEYSLNQRESENMESINLPDYSGDVYWGINAKLIINTDDQPRFIVFHNEGPYYLSIISDEALPAGEVLFSEVGGAEVDLGEPELESF